MRKLIEILATSLKRIVALFQKNLSLSDWSSARELHLTIDGVAQNPAYPPLRHVLITATDDLNELRLQPGDLGENIVVCMGGLHDLPSGTILQIAKAKIQLTFHCEPCKRVTGKRTAKRLLHRRGVLGKCINDAKINVGDSVRVLKSRFESIPYHPLDRLHWYLKKQLQPVTASNLLYEIGLPACYARALPRMLEKLPDISRNAVVFGVARRK